MGTDLKQRTDQANKVLIIDDDLTNKAILEDILHSNGYETRYASDGTEGLKTIAVWQPSVILLDLVMPGLDGIGVLKELRSMDLPSRPSVIAEDKRNLETILAITGAMSATLDPSEVLNIIVNKVAGVTEAVRCSIVLIVKDDEGYVLATHEDPAVRELKLDLSKYPEIKEVISTKAPLALDDVINHPLMAGVKNRIADLKDMSILIVPIVFNDEVLGTLFLRTRKKENGFSRKEIDFCRIVANSSFHALRNARLFEKVTKEKEYLREIALKDQLTSLYNHNFFYSRLEEEFERAVRYETPLSLIMLDIDNFKQVNDTYGHRVGDVVLREIAAMVKRGVRKTDIVARYGGEEFAVILPHTLLKGAVDEAERLREIVESHAYAGLVSNKITVSIGVAAYPQKGAMNSGDLVNYADDALYKAKWSGKNCVRVAET